jgi:RNA polymerase sigma-70 factor (ECF subfamily)
VDAEEPWREAARRAVAGCPAALIEAALVHVAAALAAGGAPAHAADLALAYCVGHGAAARRFDEHVGDEMAAAARAIDRDPAFVDEVCQRTRVRLVVGEAGAPPRIAGYRGTGPLRAWVAIAAQRVALNAKREARAGGPAADVLADLVDREPDPELRHLRTLYRSELREALARALAGLDDRRRAVLRLRFVEGLELAHIGRLYRVHESTASRWVAAGLEAIGRATREHLIARLAVGVATADSVARMVQSQLDLSIARLLAVDGPALPGES